MMTVWGGEISRTSSGRYWSRCCRSVPGRGGRLWPRRQLIDGIRFQVRTGVPWRDMPVEYGPWGRVYDLFRRWQRASRAAR
ncbi:transposase [Streptomyces sp. NPDC051643]|uniref:transposase n=1 Tax=Streptomyces sp. NPDC051643 TaxID=3365665 RepID=UPI0037BB22A8